MSETATITDTAALDGIAGILRNSDDWDADAINAVADVVRATGRTVDSDEDEEGHPYEDEPYEGDFDPAKNREALDALARAREAGPDDIACGQADEEQQS